MHSLVPGQGELGLGGGGTTWPAVLKCYSKILLLGGSNVVTSNWVAYNKRVSSKLYDNGCCIFRPAFGCCAPQTLVEIFIFSIFVLNSFNLGINHSTSILVQTKNKFFLLNFVANLLLFCIFSAFSTKNTEN